MAYEDTNRPVQLDAATRARVERVWRAMNDAAASEHPPRAPVSKTAVYRLVIAWGCAEYERAYGLKAPRGADEFSNRRSAKKRARRLPARR